MRGELRNQPLHCIPEFSERWPVIPVNAPLTGGLCVNSYIFWNDRTTMSATGLDWQNALPVIAAHPYGADWLKQCVGSDGRP